MPYAYEDRMMRVIDYIHENPSADLSLDRLADVAAMSRFHWHRVFCAMTGETCAQAVRRVRLNRAAALLIQSDQKVADIAKLCGIPNVRSFTRIFKESYGVPPAAFRRNGDLKSPLLAAEKGIYPMHPIEVTSAPTRRLATLAHKGAYTDIGVTFEKLSSMVTARDLWQSVQGMMGIYYDDPNIVAAADLRSHAGIVLADQAAVPDGLEQIDVEGGRVAVMHYKGPYAGLKAAYDYLYGEWLPKSGEEPRDVAVSEMYLNSPLDTAPDELLTDVYLPIK